MTDGIRQFDACQLIERSINRKFRKTLWTPFMTAVRRYNLIEAGDRIAVCISGGKDSMLLAKLMQELARHTEVPFSLRFLTMDPGYNPANRQRLEDNAALLRIPLEIFETNIFAVADRTEKNPCYLCARMRRGHLYSRAKEMGCTKIALGHHFNDVIETTLMAMLWGAQLQGMLPKLHSDNFPGMELIRPLYCVREDDIIAWARYNGLEFLQCACRFTDRQVEIRSARHQTKELIRTLKASIPDVESNIFNSIHAVSLDTMPGYKTAGEHHTFLENYDQ